MARKEYIKQYYGSGRGCKAMLQPIEDDYSADSFPDRKWRKNEDIALIIDDDSRRNSEVRIIKEAKK